MNVIDWLLDGDPAIRWQVMRDLTDAPPAWTQFSFPTYWHYDVLRGLVLRWYELAAPANAQVSKITLSMH